MAHLLYTDEPNALCAGGVLQVCNWALAPSLAFALLFLGRTDILSADSIGRGICPAAGGKLELQLCMVNSPNFKSAQKSLLCSTHWAEQRSLQWRPQCRGRGLVRQFDMRPSMLRCKALP